MVSLHSLPFHLSTGEEEVRFFCFFMSSILDIMNNRMYRLWILLSSFKEYCFLFFVYFSRQLTWLDKNSKLCLPHSEEQLKYFFQLFLP